MDTLSEAQSVSIRDLDFSHREIVVETLGRSPSQSPQQSLLQVIEYQSQPKKVFRCEAPKDLFSGD